MQQGSCRVQAGKSTLGKRWDVPAVQLALSLESLMRDSVVSRSFLLRAIAFWHCSKSLEDYFRCIRLTSLRLNYTLARTRGPVSYALARSCCPVMVLASRRRCSMCAILPISCARTDACSSRKRSVRKRSSHASSSECRSLPTAVCSSTRTISPPCGDALSSFFGAVRSQASSSSDMAITVLRDLPHGRRTGRPNSRSHLCTVRTPRPK